MSIKPSIVLLSLIYIINPLLCMTRIDATTTEQSNIVDVDDNDSGYILFTPPTNWRLAEPQNLPPHVKAMVVGEGSSAFPPSINLSSEPYDGTLKNYLKIVKSLNNAKGYEWKDLGTILTEAGNGNLSQVDTKTQWGDVRLMHVIIVKDSHVYILTASALKKEFSLYYREFFAAMRSLRVTQDEPNQKNINLSKMF